MTESGEPGFLGRHRWGLVIATLATALAAWLAFGYFGVQTLFIDDEVDEADPVFDSGATIDTVTDPATGAPPASVPGGDPVIENLGSGQFISRSHSTSGLATVLGDGTGQRFLRLTEFATDNGPDVDVYLSTAAPDAEESTLDDDFVSLGEMTGNVGDQNYEIPPDVDLGRYGTVVLWCTRFSVAFGAAPLA